MNQKAFNLFTALVSFVLIMLTMLLVNSMTDTESTTVSTINDISAQSQMQTAADLARADAIQVFNYGIRFTIEEFLSRPYTWYPLPPGKNWKEIKEDYAKAYFGGTGSGVQFADTTAKTMIGILEVGQTFGRYEIQLEKDEEQLRNALVTIINASVSTGEFFEVVNCDMPETGSWTPDQIQNCLGTFYVKLKMGLVDQATYEKLPRIVIRNTATGDYLKQGILPQTDFRIYVPLRIFKAIAQAKYYADTGIFSKQGYYTNLMLGMCDSGRCAPRADATGTTTQSNVPDAACPGTKGNIPGADAGKAKIRNWKANIKDPKGGSATQLEYNADDVGSIKETLQKVVIAELCTDASGGIIDVDKQDKLDLVQDNSGCDIYSSSVLVDAFEGKTIRAQYPYNTSQYDDAAYCARTTEIRARVRFRETDTTYKVNKLNENIYTIELVDSYQASTFNKDTCYTKCNDKPDLAACSNFSCTPNNPSP